MWTLYGAGEMVIRRSRAIVGTAIAKKRSKYVPPLALAASLAALAGTHAAEPISPRRLIEIVDISGPAVSPDGERVAFRTEQASVERNTYDAVWYVQDIDADTPARRVGDGGVPLRTSAGLPLPASVAWSLDGRWIYYRALVAGRIDVWRASADGSGAEPVTRDPADVRAFVLGEDGKTLRYSVGATRDEVAAAEQSEYERGIRLDPSVPIGQGGLFRSGNIEGRLATQRLDVRGDGFARLPLLSEVPDQWKEIDPATGRTRMLAASEAPPSQGATVALPANMPAPWRQAHDAANDRIAVLTRVGHPGGMIRKPDVELSAWMGKDFRRHVRCQAEPCVGKAISGIQWRPHSDDVVYTVTEPMDAMAQSIFRWDVVTGEVLPVQRSRGLLNGGERYGVEDAGCGLSAEVSVCVAADANQPPRLERIDLETGERRVLFNPNMALASDVSAGIPVEQLRWTDADGRSFTGQFYAARTIGDRPPPLFIAYYYCPGFLRSGFGGEWPLASLAEHGIAALCINYGPFYFDAVERFNVGLSAVESAVDLLASSGQIDRAKVGMGELSFGTEVTLWTAFNSDLLAAASITGAVLSRSMYLHGTLKGEEFVSRARTIWQLGSPEETPQRWERIGIEFNLDKIRAPILMQVPEQEYVWLLDSAVPLMLDRKADVYVFPHAPHFKFQPRQLLAANERNLDWFRFWLQGYEDPHPAKIEQYEHWRVMKAAIDAGDGGTSAEAMPGGTDRH
ncbi:Atxe2 family lasso peptide isopeptidase [Luteimonas sp. Y-2-2-4F]|nr:Atxe2 family lasso peptide isopeptidase [Luteimonas sp. Y-2-2-4F]MCD9032692.1 Atxe2 family lasso peptide isopeptidase [Luteimonas sp. Y-2-2-4F]